MPDAQSIALVVALLLLLKLQFGIWDIQALLADDECDCDPDCMHCHPEQDEVLS